MKPLLRTVRQSSSLLWIFASVLSVLLLAPMLYLLLRAMQAEQQVLFEVVFRWRNVELLWNTVMLAATVVLGCTVLALPLAWACSRIAAFRFVLILGVLPLTIPSYVGAYALLAATERSGMIYQLTGWVIPHPVGFWGAVGVMSLFYFPYLFLNFWSSFRRSDRTLEEVGRLLGYSGWQVFWRVTVPMLRSAWLSGALMITLHVLGDFGVVSLMRYETFSYAIYQQYSASFDRVYAAWLALMLLGLTGVIVFAEGLWLRKLKLERVHVSRAAQPLSLSLGLRLVLGGFVAAVAFASVLLPIGSIAYWLRSGLVQGFGDWAEVLLNSAWISALTAVITTSLALVPAYVGVRYSGWLAKWLERSAYFGYVTPPLGLALALIFFSLQVLPVMYQSFALLMVAYVIHFLAEATGPIRNSLYLAPARLEEAARGLGRSSLQAFASVTLPLLRSGIWGSMALVFLSTLKELPITFLLAPIGFETLAKNVWSYTSEAMFASAAPYALILVLCGLVFALIVLKQES